MNPLREYIREMLTEASTEEKTASINDMLNAEKEVAKLTNIFWGSGAQGLQLAEMVGATDKDGIPLSEIFDDIVYSYDTLSARMRELSFLNKGLTITITDEREKDEEGNFKSEVFYSDRGLSEFVEFLDGNREMLIDQVIAVEGEKSGIPVEVAMIYNTSYTENIHSYVNIYEYS